MIQKIQKITDTVKTDFIIEYIASIIMLVSMQYLVVGSYNNQSIKVLIFYSFVRLFWLFFSYKVFKMKVDKIKKGLK